MAGADLVVGHIGSGPTVKFCEVYAAPTKNVMPPLHQAHIYRNTYSRQVTNIFYVPSVE